jgi:3,4-dihydroxy-9,10-secoandrosta-1,3,5(10)-triene-9,17-dione 4,5-dioxygenase
MLDIRALAYIVATHPDPATWASFGEQVLGAEAVQCPGGDLWLKLDERACRVIVQRGAAARYFASGWEVADELAFMHAQAALERAGMQVQRATAAERDRRSCIDMLWCLDHSGNRHEIVLGFKTDFRRALSRTGTTFVTGDLGMGHVALPALKFDATLAFLREVMGFGISDFMAHRSAPSAPPARIVFLHCNNARHHSLAIAELPATSGCIHLMIEVPDMDEVGRAMDRQRKSGVKLMATLGRHVNDRMTSFYLQSPSGFAIEYGCGGRLCDWSRNVVHETTAVSLWGHDFSVGFG